MENNKFKEYLESIRIYSIIGLIRNLEKVYDYKLDIPISISPNEIEEYFISNGYTFIRDTDVGYYDSYVINFDKDNIRITYTGRNYYDNESFIFLYLND